MDTMFQRHIEMLLAKEKSDEGHETFDAKYYENHRRRFERTCGLIPKADVGQTALEVGATEFFQVYLKSTVGFARVIGTDVDSDIERKMYNRRLSVGDSEVINLSISLDVESELLPLEEESIDFVLCSEVIEHLERDPMFMLCEFSRIMKVGAKLLITTPNCCSARNFWKIAQGYRPHFFMQYNKSRSLYRHNIEYDVHALAKMAVSAGYRVVQLDTHDVFEETVPEAMSLLERNGLETSHRGDCIFLLAEKTSGVVDRWPEEIYIDDILKTKKVTQIAD